MSCGEVPVAAPAVGAFHRPYGTEIHSLPNPALKRRATIRRPSGARLRKARLRLVPEGPLVVARHFSGGYVRDCEMRAVGTPDMTTDAGENVFQPSLRDGVYYNALAAINRRATIRRPSGRVTAARLRLVQEEALIVARHFRGGLRRITLSCAGYWKFHLPPARNTSGRNPSPCDWR